MGKKILLRAKRGSKIHLRKETIHCKVCNKITSKYKDSHYKKEKKLCSTACVRIWTSIRLKNNTSDKHPLWSGDNPSYSAIHIWLKKNYGKANKCENINCTKRANRFEWSNISGKYLRERSDYEMLCASCHRIKDWGDFCIRGHEFNKENTIIAKNGWRSCRTCKNYARRLRRKNGIRT